MPGFPAPFIKFREDDANGFPLAGGLLYSYAAGTSTPLATYTDQSLTVPNRNPTILDNSGRAQIWIQDGVGYKFTLTDAIGNQMWSVDNVQIPQVQVPLPPQAMPPGSIVMFGGGGAPANWLLCDGTPVSRVTYAALFANIGTTYGAGNGASTFNVPDFRGMFPLGKAINGTGAVLGSTGGTIDHTHTGPSHTHTVGGHQHGMGGHTHQAPCAGWPTVLEAPPVAGALQAGGSGSGTEASATQATTPIPTSGPNTPNTESTALTTDAGGTQATGPANPPFLSVNFIIKT